jgi:hypothetical protein
MKRSILPTSFIIRFFLLGSVLLASLNSFSQVNLIEVTPLQRAGGALRLRITWDPVAGSQAFAIRKSVAGGAFSGWDSIGNVNTINMDTALNNASRFCIQVRVKVGGTWGGVSNSRCNSFISEIWPVSLSPSNCSSVGDEVLHGFGNPLQIGNAYLHEGVDIQGSQTVGNECLKAPMGGMVTRVSGYNGVNLVIDFEVMINGVTRFIQFNHLDSIDPAIIANNSIEPGQKLGQIDHSPAGFGWTTLMSHTHTHWYGTGSFYGSTRNPFEIWNNTPSYKDPKNTRPIFQDMNGDGKFVKYRKGPHLTDYFPKDTVHNEVDIVVESVDKQSGDAPWQTPKELMYFIQKKEDATWTDAVKSQAGPFKLFDHVNFYNSAAGLPVNTALIGPMLDTAAAVKNTAITNYTWTAFATYIVTNTKGVNGSFANMDENQCFASNARTSVGTDNGYANNYDKARCIEEAKFPDGIFRVGLTAADWNGSSPVTYKEFTVDNFRPFVKKVEMKVAGGSNIYSANFEWSTDKLKFNKNTIDARAKCNKDLEIVVDMSEPMSEVRLIILDIGYNKVETTPVDNTKRKQFKFTVPADKVAKGQNKPKIVIAFFGIDMAGNSLQGFLMPNDVPAAQIDKRKIDGTWEPGVAPVPDVIHKFQVDSIYLDISSTDATCKDKSDGAVDLTPHGGEGPYTFQWSNNATGEDLSNVKEGTYTVTVKDKNLCKKDTSDKVENKYEVHVSISGGGVYTRPCDRVLEINLNATGSGGESPYTYNWPNNGNLKLYHSGPSPKSGFYTGTAKDRNGCIGSRTAFVFSVPIRCSYDPNDIIGPPNFGDRKFVSKFATLPYKIRFENDPKFATAPASRVTVDLPINNNMDMNTFRVASFGFNNWTFNVPANSSTYYKRLDLKDSLGIYVDVTAGIDQSSKKAFWIFETIDPATGLPPTSGNLGFLPVNDTARHNGEGFVDFTIRSKTSTITGDSLRAKAEIVFDNNPSIFTPRIHNIIDAKPPVSSIDQMPASSDSSTLILSLNAVDDAGGSGVSGIDLMVSENNGPYVAYAKNITDSFISFTGNDGNFYRFFTQATDNVDNKEAAKNTPDVSITITPKNFLKPIDSNFVACSADTLNIQWKKVAISAFNLQYSANGGAYVTFANGLSGTDTVYRWATPDTLTGISTIRIRAVSASLGSLLDSTGKFTLRPGPAIQLGRDTFFCQGNTYSQVLDPGAGYSSYQWSTSATSQTITVSAEGTYSVTVTNTFGCKATDRLIVSRHPRPSITAKIVRNISCFGNTDGSVNLSTSGGKAPYSYLWSNATSSEDAINLAAGTYILVLTDSNGCILRDTSAVSEPARLSIGKAPLNVKCKNGADGSIDITISGGVSPYAYLWSNSSSSQDISGLTAGNYNVRVTDASNCLAYDTTIITEPALLVSGKTAQHVKCRNGNDGSIDLTVAGGVTPYTYIWSNSATTQDLSGLGAGTYTVQVTDANGCIRRDTVTITEPSLLTASKTLQNVKCRDGNDGSIDLTVAGGTTGYTYVWSNTATTQDLSSLIAGTYSVVITDANGCVARDTTIISQPARLVTGKTFQDVKCKNGNTGSIDLTVSGGTSPYNYLWSNSATTQDLSALKAGTYAVRVTDANGCIARDTIVVTEPTLVVATKTVQHVRCKNGNNAVIDLSVSGGVGPYAYLWSNSATTQDLSALTAATYVVTITDFNLCVLKDTTVITEPALLTSSKTIQHVKCNSGSDGIIDLSISGGATPYTYLWSNTATTQDLSGLAAGTYMVTTTDANACTRRDTFVITEPALLASSRTFQNVSCKNGSTGSIDLAVTGGTTPYAYLWSNSATTQDLTAITAGTYTVRITDFNGCVRRDTAVITEPALLVTGKTFQTVKCKNGNDGSIDLTVSGGITPYIYLWSNSATTQDISSLTAATYIVRVTDGNGCIKRDTSVITEPALLATGKTFQNVKCKSGNDGNIDLSVTGGVTPYSYLWSNSATTQDISALVAGTYSVQVTDGNGCIKRDTVIITEPALLTSSKTFQHVKCKNGNTGSIDLTVSGGTTPYAYLWSNTATTQDLNGITAGTYSVRITDFNGCIRRDTVVITEPTLLVTSKTFQHVKCKNGNDGSIDLSVSGGVTTYSYLWSNSATTQDISALTAGTYTVRVTDANSCIVRDTVIITEPALLTTTRTFQHVKCKNGNNGSIDLSVSGGVTPYLYLWNNSATTQDISTLIAGTYSVRITDGNGCIKRDTIIITEPALLTSSKTFQHVKCKNGNTGSIDLTVSGGTTPYAYLWSNTATTQDLNGITAGTYSVRITDFNGCIRRDTVVITEPTLLVTSKTFQHVKCKNGNDGSIDLSVSGGVTTYSYLWSNSATTQDISALTAGTYTVRVTDANSCIARDTVIITEPALLTSARTFQHVRCKNGNNGSIDLSVSGGVTPYLYLWSNSATTQDISGLVAGTYSVRITDGNGCIRRDTVIITEPALLVSSRTFQNVKCKNGNNGSVDLTMTGGTTPYNYLWSNGALTQDINTLTAGTYTVVITDANGCVDRDTAIVTEPALLVATRTFLDVKCKNGNSGSIDLSVTGGVTPYTYVWSNSAIIQDVSNLVAGTYMVTVTDANLCTDRDTVVIKEPALLLRNITVNDVLCHGGSDGNITVTGTGGVAPYAYLWSSGESVSSITGKTKGVYSVRITDANACVRRDTLAINEPSAPLSLGKTLANIRCHDGSDGSIDLTVAGGTLPYTYSWSNSTSTEDQNNVKEGTYTLLITDRNNCLLRDTTVLTQPLAPLSSSRFILDVKCFAGNDGAIDLGVNGGTTPYTYLWSNTSATQDISGLATGTYTVTVTDANSCLLRDTGIVKQPAAALASTLTDKNINCFGGTDGSVTAAITGGTKPYLYYWSNGAVTRDISSVKEGKYVLVITDSNKCTHSDSITLQQPAAPLTALLTADDVDCFGDNSGSITLAPAGGTAAYTYNWSNAAVTKDINGLLKGMYKVIITDVNSCTYTDSIMVNEPPKLIVNAFGTSATKDASNGSAWAEIKGGTLPYKVQWNDAGAQTNDTALNLSVGFYIVKVTDDKGCSMNDTVFVLDAPLASAITVHPNPSAGEIITTNLSALGLDEPITFEIYDMNGKMFMNFKVQGKDIHTFDLYDSFSNGTYIIRIHNSRGVENRRLILIR